MSITKQNYVKYASDEAPTCNILNTGPELLPLDHNAPPGLMALVFTTGSQKYNYPVP